MTLSINAEIGKMIGGWQKWTAQPEEAYLFFSLFKFDHSIKKQIINDRKIYSIDTGLINAVAFKFSKNSGHILENLVFLELRRQGADIFYHLGKKECDFLVRQGTEISAAIQVSYDLSDPKTREREIAGLVEAIRTYRLKNGTIVSMDEEDSLTVENFNIEIVPARKWLLQSGEQPVLY